jgi:hypothetical protein
MSFGEEHVERYRAAVGAEKAELRPITTAARPSYDEYRARTGREVPVVVLERVSS